MMNRILCDVLGQTEWKLGPPGGAVRIASEVAKPLASLFFRMVAVNMMVGSASDNILAASRAMLRAPGIPLVAIGAAVIQGLRGKGQALESCLGPWATRLQVAPFTLGFFEASRRFHAGIARDPTWFAGFWVRLWLFVPAALTRAV